MHEMSIAENILHVAIEEARKHHARKIGNLTLRIGKLRQIIPETLRFCFDVISRDTIAAGATLTIEEIPVEAWCHPCDQEFDVEDFIFVCPVCGSSDVRMIRGDELILAEMELE